MSQTLTSIRSKNTMVVGDQSLNVAHLDVLNFERLVANDPVETAKLLKAGESEGFFYVNFDKELSQKVSAYLNASYRNSHEYFSKPFDEKMKDFREGVDNGYKRAGIESFEVPRNEQESFPLPSPFANNPETTLDLANICDLIVRTILQKISQSIDPDKILALEEVHHPKGTSDSGIKFVSGPTKAFAADAPDTTHTDGGSITLLWCEKWASQIQSKETKEWLWIDPKPGCVLVNFANYLQSKTDGRLHSPVHRVSQPADGLENRYFVSYFMRPNH